MYIFQLRSYLGHNAFFLNNNIVSHLYQIFSNFFWVPFCGNLPALVNQPIGCVRVGSLIFNHRFPKHFQIIFGYFQCTFRDYCPKILLSLWFSTKALTCVVQICFFKIFT